MSLASLSRMSHNTRCGKQSQIVDNVTVSPRVVVHIIDRAAANMHLNMERI